MIDGQFSGESYTAMQSRLNQWRWIGLVRANNSIACLGAYQRGESHIGSFPVFPVEDEEATMRAIERDLMLGSYAR